MGTPDSLALASSRGRWTGSELLSAAERLADEMDGAREPGTPVVAMVSDIAATVLLTLAGDLAGVPMIHVDPAAPRPPGGLVVRDGEPPSGGRLWHLAEGLVLYAAPAAGVLPLAGLPPGAQIFQTSGSTGIPVNVVRDAVAVLADARRVGSALGYEPGSALVVSAPVFHLYGHNYGLLAALVAGVTVHYRGPRSIPSQLARAVREGGARTLIAHPAQYRLLAAEAENIAGADFAGLRRAVSAGAPLPTSAAQAILARHQFDLYNCYGSSEAGAVTLTPLTGQEEPGDAGIPLPGVAVRVAEPADGLGGELLLRTDSLASGYLTPDGLMPLAERGGWYRTGDLAELAGERLRLLGRLASVINVAGRKVSPLEVERVLAGHPAVTEVQVVGEDDAARGQVPVARVVLTAPASVADLLDWCRTRLAPYQLPRRIDIRADLPRSVTGKPLRAEERS